MNPRFISLLVYTGVSLAVMLPLLLPGFILTLDMVFVPHPPLADISRSSFPFHAVLHWLSYAVPADILQKILLLAILVLSGYGAHCLVRHLAPHGDRLWQWGWYAAGLLYMINPFVYDRFMTGQYAVLLGYALLPFFVRALFVFVAEPAPGRAIAVALWAVAIGIVSVHSLGLIAVVGLVALGLGVWRHRRQKIALRDLGVGSLLMAGVWIIGNLFWLVPLVMGQGNTSAALQQFTTTDRLAFATLGDSFAGQLWHVLSLQGFWAETTGMFILPQDRISVWPVLVVALLALVAVGVVGLWQRQRFVAVVLGASGLIAMFLATGILGDLLAYIIPFFAGYREPQKFVGLVALMYAVFGAFGLVWLMRHIRKPVAVQCLLTIGLLLPVALTPTTLWGFGGQLAPRHYPADWYTMRDILQQDPQATTLFLPWHKYMTFGFSERIIENPAAAFFETNIVIANDPEFRGVQAVGGDTRTQLMHQLLAARPPAGEFALATAAQDIKYVLLAKEYDFADVEPLLAHSDFTVISDTDNLTLYRNQSWKETASWNQ